MLDEKKLEHIASNLSLIDIYAEMFRKGDFSFIVEGEDEDGNLVSHEKQREALEMLASGKYDEMLYGGAAGGAKTWTGCVWLMFMGICYPGIKSFIGRNELKDILDSVYVTFNKVARAYGFTDWKFNAVKNFIQFGNGSHINLIEVKFKPSDPMYEDVGSTEYTIGWGEEVGEWHETAATVLASRVGRHLNKKDINGKIREVPIKGTVLWTCNPKNNWAKREFYNKHLNGTLEPNKAYLQSLVTDNPFIEKEYIGKLKKLSKKNKSLYERYFKGNWNYVDNPYQLAEQEMIEAVFSNDQTPEGKRYVTADVARFGSDKARIGYWEGWRLKEVISLDISKTTDVELAIKTLRYKYRVPRTRTVVDQDGVGGGVVDGVGAIGFKNNGRAIRKGKDAPNYKNLQVQCLYELADRINEGILYIEADLTGKERSEITEELAQIQSKGDPDPERKLDCKSKGDIKQDIGRSPDWRDMLMMRAYFDLKSSNVEIVTHWN